MMERDGDDASGQTPLKGIVLCCTSLTTDVRTKLAEVATQMGAVHKLDLTADVTHLVVGCITTPKYQYVAKDRPDIKVLDPSWVEAVRDAWMEGGDVDVAELEEKHRLPVFAGLQICVTGFDDMEQRGYISNTVEEHGATYHGDLTKQITHLIAAAPQGAKYLHAKQWGLKVVSLKWFADSLSRGMALDESLYDPTMPAEEQGRGAFRTMPRSRTSLGKRIRDSNVGAAVGEEPGKKKLRRTASTRLESQSQDMWSQLSTREGGQTTGEADRWRDDPTSEDTSKNPTSERDFTRPDYATMPSHIPDAPQGLFTGCHILILGFDDKRTQLLHRFLKPNGATILYSPDQLENAALDPFFRSRWLVIPHADTDLKPPDVPPGTHIVTEWWVERCIHTKQLLNPTTDILSRSLSHIHIPGFSELIVTSTGFEGVDLRQLAQAIRLIGATYQESIETKTSAIISAASSIKKEKAFYAQKHGIPVVKVDWLWNCIKTSSLASFEKFRLEQSVPSAADFAGDACAPSPTSSEASRRTSGNVVKGKDDQPTKRLSTTRKRATPSLSLQASRTPAPTVPRPPPIVHEDNDGDSASIDTEALTPLPPQRPSQRRSHPLQEVSPNRSPRKSGETSNEKKVIANSSDTVGKPSSRTVSPEKEMPLGGHDPTVGATTPELAEPAKVSRPREQLTADLTELLNRQTASRPGSASTTLPPHKRKSRPLGRAPSGISNRSLSASAQSDSLSQNAADAAVDGFTPAAVTEPAPPSTQLGYETADAEAHRLQMSKKMGMSFQEEGGLRRVASVGTVKDSSFGDDVGVGNRVKGRRGAR